MKHKIFKEKELKNNFIMNYKILCFDTEEILSGLLVGTMC